MAAAWSFSKKDKTGSVRRVVYGTSLDGYQLRARLCLEFDPPLEKRQAETVAAECARAAKEILGDQISEGRLPLTLEQLESRVRHRSSGAVARGGQVTIDAIDVVDERGERVASSLARGADPKTVREPARSTIPPRQVSSVPPTLASPSAPGRSGVMPAVSPEPNRSVAPPAANPTTLWPRALASCRVEAQPAEVGRLVAAPFRDSVAVFLFTAVIACEPTQADRMSFIEGNAPPVVVDGLRREAAAYVAVLFYTRLIDAGVPQNIAVEILQAMCQRAMPAVGLPVKDVSRYMARAPASEEFCRRAAALLGRAEQSAAIQRQLTAVIDIASREMQACARDVKRLVGLV